MFPFNQTCQKPIKVPWLLPLHETCTKWKLLFCVNMACIHQMTLAMQGSTSYCDQNTFLLQNENFPPSWQTTSHSKPAVSNMVSCSKYPLLRSHTFWETTFWVYISDPFTRDYYSSIERGLLDDETSKVESGITASEVTGLYVYMDFKVWPAQVTKLRK